MGGRFHHKQEPRDKNNHISVKENKIKAGLLPHALAGARVQGQTHGCHRRACSGGSSRPFPHPLAWCWACPALQLRPELPVTTPGSGHSAEEVLHQGKGKGRRREALFQGLSQCNLTRTWPMAFSFFFFFLTPKTKWQFIVGSLTECWKDLHEVNSKFIQVYGHSAIILIPRTRECFTLAAISFGTKISGTLGNTNP